MTDPPLPWLDPMPPWLEPVPDVLCAGLPLTPADVPLVELPGTPSTAAEVVALKSGRFVPLFGLGPTRDELVRLLASLARALGTDADPRGVDHALALCVHPLLGITPLRWMVRAVGDGRADPELAGALLGYAGLLGASDGLREQIAREVATVPSLSLEAALALGAGGATHGSFREHYGALSSGAERDAVAVRAMRAWFDFVLARRFHGLDHLEHWLESDVLDAPSRWLAHTARLVAGEESARNGLTETADAVLAPLKSFAPRVVSLMARDLAEIVAHPIALRFHHLRAAASRDHAAMAIRAWLTAAVETESDEVTAGLPIGALGPEPSRAGRAAIEARAAANEFLLDWFVPDRDAREAMDRFAEKVLRGYHRLRGAHLLLRAERSVRPPGGQLTNLERYVWGR